MRWWAGCLQGCWGGDNTNIEGHKKKAKEIEDSLGKLLPDPDGKHVDTHAGLPRELRRLGAIDIAMIFETIDMFRAGRWYGSKGNGDVMQQCLEFIEKIEEWASK